MYISTVNVGCRLWATIRLQVWFQPFPAARPPSLRGVAVWHLRRSFVLFSLLLPPASALLWPPQHPNAVRGCVKQSSGLCTHPTAGSSTHPLDLHCHHLTSRSPRLSSFTRRAPACQCTAICCSQYIHDVTQVCPFVLITCAQHSMDKCFERHQNSVNAGHTRYLALGKKIITSSLGAEQGKCNDQDEIMFTYEESSAFESHCL